MKKKFTLSKAEQDEINAAYDITLNPNVKRRLTVLKMYGEGKLIREIAAATHYEIARTSLLVRQYKNGGLKAIFGNECLSLAEITKIESALKSAENPRTKRKLKILLLRAKGLPIAKTAKQAKCGESAVERLMRVCKSKGLTEFLKEVEQGKLYNRKGIAVGYMPTPKELAELEAAYETANSPSVQRNLTVLILRGKGLIYRQIGEDMNMDSATVTKIVRGYKENGLTDVLDRQRHHKDKTTGA